MALYTHTAVQLRGMLESGEVSATEVMEAHLDRIADINPAVNAIVDLQPERALEEARSLDARWRSNAHRGLLYGLPVAVKDLIPAAGFHFTQGTVLYRDRIATVDHALVERERAAGAIVIGKTNVSEFGLGSHTFNAVYGVTRNPYHLDLTAGGSSGGAAAALAARMLPLADGSDTAGSLRNPASFCNVVGLRPTPGRIPSFPDSYPFGQLSVKGPMARTVADLALFLEALSGGDARTPVSLDTQLGDFYPLTNSSDESVSGRRIRVAWSPDLNGAVTVSKKVLAALEPVVARLGDLGWEVEFVTPDLSAAIETFTTLRALQMHAVLGSVVQDHPELIKEDARWNVGQGAALDGPTIARAYLSQGDLVTTMREFFDSYDLLITPACQVVPFPVTTRYPRQIDGVPMNDYLTWMQLPSAITATGCPSISLPAAFTPEGLPVGLQLVGPRQGERQLLNLAAQFERIFGVGHQAPVIEVDSALPNFVEVD